MPLEEKPAALAQLYDQVNAERVRLLANERPFAMQTVRVRGYQNDDKKIVATYIDTILRRPVPTKAYAPHNVLRRGEGVDAELWVVKLPEISDLADTAFTNNHCTAFTFARRATSSSA
jgi:hypothetical protein